MRSTIKYLTVTIVAFICLISTEVSASPSKFEVMKMLKWRVIEALEINLHQGNLAQSERQLVEYTLYKIKSSIGQFTDKSYFEELYHQTFYLIKIKEFLPERKQKDSIDDLISFYQNLLREMYQES